MKSVTSAEFQKNFGTYKEAALRAPVAITNHGRESLVVLSADEYQRLKAMEARRVKVMRGMPDDMLAEIDTAIEEMADVEPADIAETKF